jgi:hypothetical protein
VSCLYKAANALLIKVQRVSPLKAWATRLAERIGAERVRVAVAGKLAAILLKNGSLAEGGDDLAVGALGERFQRLRSQIALPAEQ